jgi:hypothetical protein
MCVYCLTTDPSFSHPIPHFFIGQKYELPLFCWKGCLEIFRKLVIAVLEYYRYDLYYRFKHYNSEAKQFH